jgi:DNA-binding LacI/PurR family transcriptional regulator
VRGNVHELSKNSQEMLSKRPIVKVFNSNLINCPDVSFDCDDVNPDDDAVGVMAARALFNRGYTRMHVLKTSAKNLIIKERVFSFVRTCSEIGVSVSVGPVVDDLDFYSEIRSTIEVLKSEIKQNGDEKIGIFIPVSSDEPIVWNKVLESEHISLGASNDGVSVALCSNVFDFDEAQRSYFCNIDINTHEIGRLAAELLYLKQYRKEDTISIHARVKPRLIPFV